MMETLCKVYLELANVVPPNCISSREKELQRYIDAYGIALMLIAEGCAEPSEVAHQAIIKVRGQRR
ncbi:MAG: hypothetical protein WC829_00985 [Hyphomicrobium sp.]|jgi:hypothetical protein